MQMSDMSTLHGDFGKELYCTPGQLLHQVFIIRLLLSHVNRLDQETTYTLHPAALYYWRGRKSCFHSFSHDRGGINLN